MEAAFRISTTHEVAPVLVPSFHTFLHLRLAISSVSSLADHLLFHPSRRIRFVSTSLSCPIVSVLFVFRLLPSFLLAIILRSLGIRELLHFVSLFESPHPRPFSLPLSVWLLHQRPSSNLLPLASSLLFRFFLSPTRRPFASRICSHFPLFRSRIAFKSRRELFTFCPLFPFLSPSSSRDLHSFPPTPVSFHLSRDSYTISFDRFVDTSDNSWQEDPKYLFWKLNARFFFFSLFFLRIPRILPFYPSAISLEPRIRTAVERVLSRFLRHRSKYRNRNRW